MILNAIRASRSRSKITLARLEALQGCSNITTTVTNAPSWRPSIHFSSQVLLKVQTEADVEVDISKLTLPPTPKISTAEGRTNNLNISEIPEPVKTLLEAFTSSKTFATHNGNLNNLISITNQNINGLSSDTIISVLMIIYKSCKRNQKLLQTIEKRGLDRFLHSLSRRVEFLQPKELSQCAYVLGTLNFHHQEIAEAVTKRSINISKTFRDHEMYSNLLLGISRLNKNHDLQVTDLFSTFEKKMQPILPKLSPNTLANVISSYANVGIQPVAEFLRAFMRVCYINVKHFTHTNFASFVSAFAKLNITPPEELMLRSFPLFARKLNECDINQLCETIEAFAHLSTRPSHDFMEVYLHAVSPKLTFFKPRQLAEMWFSFGKLLIRPSKDFTTRYVVACMKRLSQFDSEELSKILWSFAQLEVRPVQGFSSACLQRSSALLKQFSNDELADIVWAFAHLDLTPPSDWINQVQLISSGRLKEFSPQALCNLLDGLSHFDSISSPNKDWIQQFEDVFSLVFLDSKLYPKQLSQCLSSAVRLCPDSKLFTLISDTLQRRLPTERFSAPQITSMLYDLAVYLPETDSLSPPVVVESLVDKAVKKRHKGFLEKDAPKMLWSLTVFDLLQYEPVKMFVEQLYTFLNANWRSLDAEAKKLFLQVDIFIKLRYPGSETQSFPSLSDAIKREFHESLAEPEFSRASSQLLTTLQTIPKLEVLSSYQIVQGFTVDAVIPKGTIAIDYNGPSDYTKHRKLLGNVLLKHKILRLSGWEVASIPFWEWNELVGIQEQQEYVRRKLKLPDLGDNSVISTDFSGKLSTSIFSHSVSEMSAPNEQEGEGETVQILDLELPSSTSSFQVNNVPRSLNNFDSTKGSSASQKPGVDVSFANKSLLNEFSADAFLSSQNPATLTENREKVAEIMKTLQMENYLQLMIDNEIIPSDFLDFTEQDVKDLIPTVGPRKRLWRYIVSLKEKDEFIYRKAIKTIVFLFNKESPKRQLKFHELHNKLPVYNSTAQQAIISGILTSDKTKKIVTKDQLFVCAKTEADRSIKSNYM